MTSYGPADGCRHPQDDIIFFAYFVGNLNELALGSPMTNQVLVGLFESDRLPGEFHHAQHVQLAFAYLSLYPPLQALGKFSDALKRFAAARGKVGLYHETITHAYFFLIRERMARTPGIEWEEFTRQNPDLLQWKPGILRHYYRETTLQSDLARSVFLLPDKFTEL
jgi:hypothetical protein